MPPHIRHAREEDRDAIVALVVAAFVTEPAIEYFFADEYFAHSPSFFGFLLDQRLKSGEVWVAEHEGEVASVAMWNTPNDPELDSERSSKDWETVASKYPADARLRLEGYSEFLHDHKPTDEHFYLGVIATAPALHGRGFASAVLRPTLAAADASGHDSFLETGTKTNVGFYSRHGFVVDAEVDLPNGPRIWWMRRPANPG
jgi:GNAT superfamily N-acetyltransferase